MDLLIDRWLHILAGVTWVGLLYYFNFVQVPGLAAAKADGTAPGITKHIAPRALLWFRWAAIATWLTGAYYLARSGTFMDAFILQGPHAYLGIGAWLGTIMLFNVWVLIWPNQKKCSEWSRHLMRRKQKRRVSHCWRHEQTLCCPFPCCFSWLLARSHISGCFERFNSSATEIHLAHRPA